MNDIKELRRIAEAEAREIVESFSSEVNVRAMLGATDRLTPRDLLTQAIAQALAARDERIKQLEKALSEQLSYKLHYKNDDGSDPDICDEESWDDVGNGELREILADVLSTARAALKKDGI